MRRTETDFNFIYGVFRCREARLLERSALEGLLGADSYGAIVSQLPESPFGSEIRRHGEGVEAIDLAVAAEMAELKDVMDLYVTSPQLRKLVLLPWDIHNLKATVLAGLAGGTPDELFGPEGDLSLDELRAHREEMEFEFLPQDIYDALQNAWIAYFEEGKDTQAFEVALDRQRVLLLLRIAEDCSKDITKYLRVSAELKLAESILRAKTADLPWKLIRWGFTEFSSLSRIEEVYALPNGQWSEHLAAFSKGVFRDVLEKYHDGVDIGALVSEMRGVLLDVYENWKYSPPSIEYCYYYLTRKLGEVYSLRMLLLGKLNRLPIEEIRRRITYVYV